MSTGVNGDFFEKVSPSDSVLNTKKDEKRKILSKSCAPERNIRDIYMKRFDSVLKYDSGDESFSSDNESDDILEIGPPKCIKYQAENELVDLPKQLSSENTPNKPFYNKEIKEYLRGGFTCDFCLANVLQWPNFSNQAIYNSLDSYCCEDYKEYVQGLLDYHIYLDSLRKKMRFDFRTLCFKSRDKNKKGIGRKFDDMRKNDKFYSQSLLTNTTQSTIKTDTSKSINKEKERKSIDNTANDQNHLQEIKKELEDLDDQFKDFYEKKGASRLKPSRTESLITEIDGPSSDEKKKSQSIHYYLSSFKYIEKGWTQNLNYEQFGLSNDEEKLPDNRIDSGNVATTIELWSSHLASPIIKYYKNRKPFQTILSDRTGNVYYPNGRLALLLSDSGEYRSFMAFNNENNDAVQIASFDSNGNGFCNYPNGSLRYQINYIGGINFDQNGNCIKKWLFPNEENNVAFHPIVFAINEYMSMQIHGRSKIVFIFRSKYGTCRFLIRLKNNNKYSSRYDKHFKCFFSDTTFLSLKNRTELLLQLIHENVQQSSAAKNSTKIKKFHESGANNINLRLPRLSTPFIDRKRSMSTVTSFKNLNIHNNSLGKMHNAITQQNYTKSATNSINFSLNSSS